MTGADSNTVTSIHVRRACEGDQTSVTWLVQRLSPVLLAVARDALANPAPAEGDPDDLVADAWLALLPRLPEIEARDGRFTPPLVAYLSSCIRNEARNLGRRSERSERVGARTPRPREPARDALQQLVREELHGLVMRELDRLDSCDRTILVRRAEGLRVREIAAELDMRPNTVTVQYLRTLAKLRARFPGSVFDELEE